MLRKKLEAYADRNDGEEQSFISGGDLSTAPILDCNQQLVLRIHFSAVLFRRNFPEYLLAALGTVAVRQIRRQNPRNLGSKNRISTSSKRD